MRSLFPSLALNFRLEDFQAALQKASDLEGKEFEFHVIPMVDDFDYEPFYKEFITLSRGKSHK